MPPTWRSVRIDTLATFVRGVSFKKDVAQESPTAGCIAVLRAGNLQDGRVVWDDLIFVPNSFVSREQRLRDGDIVVAMSSGSASVVGKAASIGALDAQREAAFGAFCGLWRPQQQRLAGWLQQFFQSPIYRQAVSAAAAGVNINNLRADHIGSLTIPLPPFTEQRRIVAKLEALQARSRRAREAVDAVPPLLEKLRQSILAAAFRGDLTKDWRAKHPDVEPASELLKRIRIERRKKWEEAELAKMKAKGKPPTDDRWKAKYKEPEELNAAGLPRLPRSWCWTSLDELVSTIESGRSPRSEGRAAGPSECGVLKVSAITWGRFDPAENKALLRGERIGDTPTVQAGDLLISRANTVQLVGAVAVADTNHPNLMLSDKTLRLVPAAASVSPHFLLHALRTRAVRRIFEEDATPQSQRSCRLS